MTLSYRNGVSIAEIIVYVPCLAVAIFLAIRHGLGRSAGWVFLIVFCLARIIGPAMELATISDPTNTSLYTGYVILSNIGLSPLELAALGLLSRLIDNINKNHHIFLSTRILKLVELAIIVGLILGIVGGIDASSAYIDAMKRGGKYQPSTLSKASTALFIVSYVAIVAFTVIISFSTPHADSGEKRLLLAVAITLPFLLVRLVYSAISTFAHISSFNLMSGSVTVQLCVALIEEFIVVLVFESVGLTLQRANPVQEAEYVRPLGSADSTVPIQKKEENVALRIAKKTIIGRIIMAFVPRDTKNSNIEMEQGRRAAR